MSGVWGGWRKKEREEDRKQATKEGTVKSSPRIHLAGSGQTFFLSLSCFEFKQIPFCTYDSSKVRRGRAPDGSNGRGSEHGDNGFGAVGDIASNTVSLHYASLAHGLGALTDTAVEISIGDALRLGLELACGNDGSLGRVLAPESILGKVEAGGGEPCWECIHGERSIDDLLNIIGWIGLVDWFG